MAINLLLKGLGAAAGTAFNAYKKQAQPTTQPVQQAQPQQKATTNEHYNYVDSGIGMDAYKTIQQNKYNKAIDSGDTDMLTRLNADMKKVGYNLDTTYKSPVQVNPYEQQMAQMEERYAALNDQISNANQMAVQQGINRLNAQKGTINQGYDDAARQAYIMSRQSQQALPQQLASQGISGGATETAQLGLMTGYQNNLNSINTGRQGALTELGNSVVDLQNTGDLNTAEQTLQNNQAALSAYQNMINNSAGYGQWQSEFNYGKDRDSISDTNYANETAYAQKQDEYNNILDRLSMGLISPTDAVNLGVSPQDVQAFVSRINTSADLSLKNQQADLANQQSITANRVSGGSTRSASAKAPTNVESTALGYLNKGDREKAISALAAVMDEAQIKAFLEQKGFRTDDIEWNIPQETQSGAFQPSQPAGPTSLLVSYLKGQGLTSQQIADRLNQ